MCFGNIYILPTLKRKKLEKIIKVEMYQHLRLFQSLEPYKLESKCKRDLLWFLSRSHKVFACNKYEVSNGFLVWNIKINDSAFRSSPITIYQVRGGRWAKKFKLLFIPGSKFRHYLARDQ